MRASVGGRNELCARVQQALFLATKKEAEHVVDAVIGSLESTLLNNLGKDGFTLKLGSFGKFSVRHKPGILRKIPFTGETILTKDRRKVRFVSLGSLRQHEKVALKWKASGCAHRAVEVGEIHEIWVEECDMPDSDVRHLLRDVRPANGEFRLFY